jgi:DNA-binding MarR family transcriptional regulator
MTDTSRPDFNAIQHYAMIWRVIHMAVHRYGSFPTGQLLVVVTIMLLDEAGYNTTVAELAEITGMPKSNVSRYVNTEMRAGFLEEVIDPADRRRRRLFPTAAAKAEQAWHQREIVTLGEMSTDVMQAIGTPAEAGENLKRLLAGITISASSDPD